VPNKRRKLILEPQLNPDPEIGHWLAAFQDARQRTLETLHVLQDLPTAAIDWQPPEGGSSIGTVLYHIADIEADWLYVEVLEQDFPPAVSDLLTYPTRDEENRLTQVRSVSLADHLMRLERVRGLALEVYQAMDPTDFRRARSLEPYDVTPEWVLHHLMQHEAEHRSQIGALNERATRTDM